MGDVTVGIDIGTTSVKAIAADDDGNVVARTRVPHTLHVPEPNQFVHDADEAWRRGPPEALRQLGDVPFRALSVAAMVPSLTAVDADGSPITPGLLYGDERGHTEGVADLPQSGELRAFLEWTARAAPDAHGYWPAQAVANHSLAGEAVIDTVTAVTAHPLFDFEGWDADLLAEVGAIPEQLPRIIPSGTPAGRVGDAVLEPGTIDAFGEQIVAGADQVGDVLVICGTTLLVWVVMSEELVVPGFYSVPHSTPGLWLFGGPSNAGGLFLDWVRRVLGPRSDGAADPDAVPVWVPYLRGERVPHHAPHLRGRLLDLDLTHGTAAVLRAGFEAAGFVVRRSLEAAGVTGRRVVATGGGTRVDDWMQALADVTGLPVDVTAVPEGAALGAAFFARVALGLEDNAVDGARWARTARRVEPDPAWLGPTSERFDRFVELDPVPQPGS